MNHQAQVKNIFQKAKQDFLSMDCKTKRLVREGLRFSFAVTIFSICLLISYLTIHNPNLFIIGFSIFKSSIFFHLAFIAFGIIFQNLKKQMN